MEKDECSQCAHARGWKAGENRQGMDEALVQNSQDDVNDEDCCQQQQTHARKGILKRLSASLERALHVSRQDSQGFALHQFGGIAQGGSRLEIEADRDRRQLPEVIYHKRADRGHEFRHCIQGDKFPGIGANVEHREFVRVVLVLWQQLDNYVVFVVRCIDGADLPRAVRRVERVGNLSRRQSQRIGFVVIDLDRELWVFHLQIGSYILQLLQRSQRCC